MANSERDEPARNPVRVPAILFLLFVMLVAGTLIWLTLASPEQTAVDRPSGPRLNVPVDIEAPPVKQAKKKPAAKKPATGPRKPPDAVDGGPDSDLLLPPPMPELPPIRQVTPLTTAPDPALVQRSPAGPLPVVSPDGRASWRAYARPFNKSSRLPRIAMVITGLGINDRVTRIAVQNLPGEVTLAFLPYADNLRGWVAQARRAGHEVLLAVPMEPMNFPRDDPGPQAMLLSLTAGENMKRLDWAMSRTTSYVGITNFMGSRFVNSRKQLRPLMKTLKARGLMFLDSYSTATSTASDMASRLGVPWVNNEIFIDKRPAAAAIDAKLKKLEQIARQAGRVVAIGNPFPITLGRVAKWAAGLKERGFILAPISAMAAATSDQ